MSPRAALARHVDTIARATPPDRDRYVDFLRALAIAAVVVGHWLVAVPTYENGRFDGVHALEVSSNMRLLTWVFQVMPLFFVVGGFANALSWSRARSAGGTWASWTLTRLERVVRPAALFLVTWCVLGILLRGGGMAGSTVAAMTWLVVVPLWFLAVYPLVTAAAPLALRLHRHFGWGVVGALALVAGSVDLVTLGLGVGALGWVNFFAVYLLFQQLGICWWDGRLPSGRAAAPLVLVGLVATVGLTVSGTYPVSMVGVPGESVANNAPPTLALLGLGVVHLGLVLLVGEPARRWLARPGVWAAVATVNLRAMTVYLWHFTALVAAAVVFLPLGAFGDQEVGGSAWWASRPAWLLSCAVVLVAIVAVVGRAEEAGGACRERPVRPWPVATAVFAASVLFTAVAGAGLTSSATVVGVPFPALLLLLVVAGALRRARPA